MTHVLFGSTNRPGLAAIDAAIQRGYEVTIVTSPGLEQFYRGEQADTLFSQCRVITVSSLTDVEQVEREVAEVHKSNPIDAALTVFEPAVVTISRVSDSLGIRATALKSVLIARDKELCRRKILEAGLNTVDFGIVETREDAHSFGEECGYPFVLKPNNGMAKVGVATISSADDIDTYFFERAKKHSETPEAVRAEIDTDGRLIAEGFATGTLYSVEAGVSSGRFIPLVLSRRNREKTNHAIELGSTMPGLDDSAIINSAYSYVEKLVGIMGFDRGILHIEIMIDDSGLPTLVEVNPRLMGGTSPSLYNLATDTNIFDTLLDYHLDVPIQSAPPLVHSVASRVIGSKETVQVRDDLPDNWIGPLTNDLAYHAVPIASGQRLEKMEFNYTSLGQIQVKSDTPKNADVKADEMLVRMEDILGVKLCS